MSDADDRDADSHVSAGLLRDRIRDQSVDGPPAALRPRGGGPSNGRTCGGCWSRPGPRSGCMPPVAGLPDLVFTANAALIHGRQAILSRFRFPQRQGEEPHYERWLSEHGFQVRRLRGDGVFRGGGRRPVLRRHALCRLPHPQRRRVRCVEIGAAVGLPRHSAGTGRSPRYYHLDTCFCPLAADMAIYYPAALGRLRPQGAARVDSAS